MNRVIYLIFITTFLIQIPIFSGDLPKPEKRIEALGDDETDAEYVPSLTKLEYEIDDFGASLQQTMGSLAGKQAPKRRINKIRDINDL
jgi:hypothetical protein